MQTRNKIIILIAFMTTVCSQAAVLLPADSTLDGQSFTFPVMAHSSGSDGQSLYVAAAPGTSPKNFALSVVSPIMNRYSGLAMEQVTLNGVENQPNPFYDQGIQFLDAMETPIAIGRFIERPIMVTANDLTRIIALDNVGLLNSVVYQTPQLQDVQSLVTSGICGLTAGYDRQAFAAVKSNASANFGDAGSGIALCGYIVMTSESEVEGKKVQTSTTQFSQVDLANTSATNISQTRAAPFDRSTPALKIGDNVVALQNIVAMHYDKNLSRLYLGLQATGNSNQGDGARSVVAVRTVITYLKDAEGNPTNNFTTSLAFDPIVPDTVFVQNANNEIVGAQQASVTVATHMIRTLYTTTRINYLVMLGGNIGNTDTTLRTVYAMPLVFDFDNPAASGTLASINAVPQDFFVGTLSPQLNYRFLKQPAVTNADIYKTTNLGAQVGGGPVPAGNVTDMFVQDDAVFVCVGSPVINQLPGIYGSYALFDEVGRIKGWTTWQLVGGATGMVIPSPTQRTPVSPDTIFGATLNPLTGDFTWLSGGTASTIMTSKRTLWGSGDPIGLATLVGLTNAEFPDSERGVFNLLNFSNLTQGLTNVSWFITTGSKKIMITESGEIINGVLVPNGFDFQVDAQDFTNGAIGTIPTDAVVISISGGVLNTLGAITSAEIASVANGNSYIVVGGVGGVAVLIHPDGSGWSTATGMATNFQSLTNDMSFVLAGSYSFVRKLICSQNYLYVLTDSVFDRIDIAASNFATGNIVSVRLANLSDLKIYITGAMQDVVVSQKLALVATSNGLWRVGNGVNIASDAITGPADVQWTKIVVPGQVPPAVTELIPLSFSGLSIDTAANLGGTVYAICGDIGNALSRLSRFSIKNLTNAQIDDTTVLPLNDIFTQNMPSYFVNFGAYKSIYETDGAMRFITNDQNLLILPQVLVIPPNIATGSPLAMLGAQPATSAIVASNITQLTRSSASGTWLLTGDFGMKVNE